MYQNSEKCNCVWIIWKALTELPFDLWISENIIKKHWKLPCNWSYSYGGSQLWLPSKEDQECKHLKSLFKTFNFTQFIDQPTRVSATSSTCLDLIATNRPYNIITYSVLPSCLSDHDTVYSVRKSNCRKAPPIVKV